MRYLLRTLPLILAAALAGCMSNDVATSSGVPIDAAKVAQIVKGKTTRTEIEAAFGKPDATSMLPDGRRALTYNYSATNMNVKVNPLAIIVPLKPGAMAKSAGTTHTQSLQIYVTKDGVVEDFEFNDNTRDVQGDSMGNVRSGQRS